MQVHCTYTVYMHVHCKLLLTEVLFIIQCSHCREILSSDLYHTWLLPMCGEDVLWIENSHIFCFKISDYSLFNNTNSKINTATGTLKFCKITQMIDACQRFPVQSHWFITAFCWHGLSASPLLFWRWRLSLAPVLYAVSWSASVSPLDPPGDPLWPAWTRTYR